MKNECHIFTINWDLMNQWFDTFDPSHKTKLINFLINKLKTYNFNIDMIENEDEKLLTTLLADDFDCFLKQKMMDANPGHLITGCEFLP